MKPPPRLPPGKLNARAETRAPEKPRRGHGTRAIPRGHACLRALPLVVALALARLLPLHAAAQQADEARLLLRIKRAWGDPPALASWGAAAATSH